MRNPIIPDRDLLPSVGQHMVDIYLKGVKIAGSPYYVEVFDPKKVALESMAKETYLHEQTEFEGEKVVTSSVYTEMKRSNHSDR